MKLIGTLPVAASDLKWVNKPKKNLMLSLNCTMRCNIEEKGLLLFLHSSTL